MARRSERRGKSLFWYNEDKRVMAFNWSRVKGRITPTISQQALPLEVLQPVIDVEAGKVTYEVRPLEDELIVDGLKDSWEEVDEYLKSVGLYDE